MTQGKPYPDGLKTLEERQHRQAFLVAALGSFICPVFGWPMLWAGRYSPSQKRAVFAGSAYLWGLLFTLSIAAKWPWLGISLGLALLLTTIASKVKKVRSPFAFIFRLAEDSFFSLTGALITSVLLGLVGVTALGVNQEAAHQLEEELKRIEALAQQKSSMGKQLERDLPAKNQAWRSRLAAAQELAKSGKFAESLEIVRRVQQEVAAGQNELSKHSVSQQTTGLFESVSADIKQQDDMLEYALSADTEVAKSKKAILEQRWLDADANLESALEALNGIKAEDVGRLPATFALDNKRSQVKQQREAIGAFVQRARKKLESRREREEAEAAQAEAYAAVCGPQPTLGGWDGEVIGLESALQEIAHDPDSIDVEKCTQPALMAKKCWVFTCNVRGKNAFGAMVLNRKTYSYSKLTGFSEDE